MYCGRSGTGPFLTILLLCFWLVDLPSASANDYGWTEDKIGKLAVKADKAARKKRWNQAIHYGEKALEGSKVLYPEYSPLYINRLKTLNRYYDRANRLPEVSDHVKKAFRLSSAHLGPDHATSKVSRLLYYKLLLAEKDYPAAILLVKDTLARLGESDDDQFKRLHYLGQLYSFYGLTNQFELEEQTIRERLALNSLMVGEGLENNSDILLDLAKNLCTQKKYLEHDALVKVWGTNFICLRN
ncbi:tetratricopeptide repeat protein [Paremcibacter congregatus]|uniref:Uncharacterized protein n=1 Tax=Paremcibacter congregatus TaxID=2043170 RepID=A0A2G4YR64_9PROT|nr:tetratricopeptide repeat protein [Paremcibacter congregatus]PHZ84760.1 hypothetical protein CRD36_10775 [Paremcibacter congregatus]QDE28952.1 tetratricopeptide repeat protein [Paremcibacter congregatus]